MDSSPARSIPRHKLSEKERPYYIITPTGPSEDMPAEEVVKTLVGRERIYALGERTPHRREVRPGDWICFYAARKGVVAHARVASIPERKQHPAVLEPLSFPWVFGLSDVRLYTEHPVVLDAQLRARLDMFGGRPPCRHWHWLVQGTRLVTEHDFRILTRWKP